MSAYYLGENDQPKTSWVISHMDKKTAVREKAMLPPGFYRFVRQSPNGEAQLKPEYHSALCQGCGRYTEEAVFKIGFSEPVAICIKGDYSHTQDRVLVVSDRFVRAIEKAKTRGYQIKPIGATGWHALLVTHYVQHKEGVLKPVEPYCPTCRLPQGAVGDFEHEEHLSIPADPNTFFTTKMNWQRMLWDRDIFIGEEVVVTLKAAGISGGYCNRLWTADEVRTAQQKAAAGKKWKPAKASMYLNGK